MDMNARNQYLDALRSDYRHASKKAKGDLLDEAEQRTGSHRKSLIRKLTGTTLPRPRWRRPRQVFYDGPVVAALSHVWAIFDHPCGDRLVPLLATEVDRLRVLGELRCSDMVAAKLQQIRSTTIDAKLRPEKTRLRLRYQPHPPSAPHLYRQIPIKVSTEWDRTAVGHCQLDFVLHCGTSSAGAYLHSLALTDIATGWWEAAAQRGRTQEATHGSLEAIHQRLPFPLKELHPDNDSGIINDVIYRYCQDEGIQLTRSRPYKKNDNNSIEQKNWTHIRKLVGYFRHESAEEQAVLNGLYANELRLYKNFFQPVMQLTAKVRRGGRLHRRYGTPHTPYHRLLVSEQLDEAAEQRLRAQYEALNPAALKRRIDDQLSRLWQMGSEQEHIHRNHGLRQPSAPSVTCEIG